MVRASAFGQWITTVYDGLRRFTTVYDGQQKYTLLGYKQYAREISSVFALRASHLDVSPGRNGVLLLHPYPWVGVLRRIHLQTDKAGALMLGAVWLPSRFKGQPWPCDNNSLGCGPRGIHDLQMPGSLSYAA
jgi:hypothetical protein